MSTSSFHLVYTVLMFVIFIGICLWAWNHNTKQRFHEASMLPFTEDDDMNEKKENSYE